MKSNPLGPHTPDDDPEPGTPGTAEDLCPECAGAGKLVDKVTRKESACERWDLDHHPRRWIAGTY
jgi:hypothetical protein